MIQLTFEPAYDSYCAMFRVIRLREALNPKLRLPINQIRILDFFLLFPFFISTIELQQQDRKFRSLGALYSRSKPYGPTPDKRMVFERMRIFQESAIQSLVTKGYFSQEDFSLGILSKNDQLLPDTTSQRVAEKNSADSLLLEFLMRLANYPFEGKDGLKKRTGLLEFRYDAI